MGCPQVDLHTPTPDGYVAKIEWAAEMSKTHKQRKCPGCGLLKIWVPQPRAPAVSRAAREETGEAVSIYRYYEIKCDHGDDECAQVVPDSEPYLTDLRKTARKMGWTRRDGKDYCPTHSTREPAARP